MIFFIDFSSYSYARQKPWIDLIRIRRWVSLTVSERILKYSLFYEVCEFILIIGWDILRYLTLSMSRSFSIDYWVLRSILLPCTTTTFKYFHELFLENTMVRNLKWLVYFILRRNTRRILDTPSCRFRTINWRIHLWLGPILKLWNRNVWLASKWGSSMKRKNILLLAWCRIVLYYTLGNFEKLFVFGGWK